jgi:hypothetical protein
MATPELRLFIDQEGGKLVAGFASAKVLGKRTFVMADSVPIVARVLEPGESRPWNDVDLTNKTLRVSIGTPNAAPTGGTFTITYGGDTTSALAYNASASDVQTALNALASISSAGGVVVTKSTSGPYRVTFNTAGARTDFSLSTVGLYPTTEAQALEAIEGDGSTREVVLLKLETQPASYVEMNTALPSASATITTVRGGAADIGEIQSFSLDPVPYDGTYTITIGSDTTDAIEFDAEAATIQAALEGLSGIGAGKVTVSGEFPNFTASFDASLTDVTQMTIDATGLTVPTGYSGDLNLNTTGIIELLDGAAQVDGTFEVEIYDTVAATSWTPIQTPCTVKEDVSGNTPASSTPLPTYITTSTAGATVAGILGLTTYADLTAANTAEAPGVPYWDTALGRINVTTA